MLNLKSLFIVLCAILLVNCTQKDDTTNQTTASIIFDTDIGPDYDDVGAITILHAMAAKGEGKLLATIASNKYEGIAAVLDVFNTYWGNQDIPIGVPKGDAVDIADWQHWSDTILSKYPHSIDSNREVAGAVEVYRKILSSQPDSSVTIVTVGFLTNLVNLLQSKPDKYSDLNGKDLVREKVKKLVSMAGGFPKGKEYNLMKDVSASKYVFNNWPTKVIFSGFEVGVKIKTGLPLVHNGSIKNDPAKDVYRVAIPMAKADSLGRSSWDPITSLVAVRGYKPYYTLQEGHIIVHDDGSNSWNDNGKGQYYLVEKESPKKIEKVIDSLMMVQPEGK